MVLFNFTYTIDSNPVSFPLFLVILQVKTDKLFQLHFLFIVLGTYADQIDSYTHFVVSAVCTFSGQID